MLTEDTVKKIANVFCCDEEEFYSYKSGPKLVSFFNKFLNKADVYQQGFPSRWCYTYNNLVDILNKSQIDRFFSHIMSKGFLMGDLQCNEVEALHKANEIFIFFNKLLKADACLLAKRDNKMLLLRESDDLVFIASGGFAKVYEQESSGRIYKKLHDEWILDVGVRSRFKREYRITKSLDDIPGVIKVFDYFDDSCAYTMEKEETTLEKYIRNNTLPDASKINCIRQVLSVMKNVHDRDVVHRDISPNNILLLNGMLKISDFGLGKDMQTINSHQTLHTKMFGQFFYCAPEQHKMLKDGDKRSDVFSLGRLLNFIRTTDPTDTHHIFRVVATKATKENPLHRYDDAAELSANFEVKKITAINTKSGLKRLTKYGMKFR
jgi:tRNA A-37 threonylcarbamoyl transferase component Bud32